MTEREELERKLIELRTEHGDLDAAVAALMEQQHYDQLKLQRMKKRKLVLKDQIRQIESALYPDIIA